MGALQCWHYVWCVYKLIFDKAYRPYNVNEVLTELGLLSFDTLLACYRVGFRSFSGNA